MKQSGRSQIRGDANSWAFHIHSFFYRTDLASPVFPGIIFLIWAHLQKLGIWVHYWGKLKKGPRREWGIQEGSCWLQHMHFKKKIFLGTVGTKFCIWKCRGNNCEGFKALGLITLHNSGLWIYLHHISKLKMILLLKKLTVFLMISLYISVGNIHSLLFTAPGWWYFPAAG